MMTHNVPHKDYRDSIYACINSWYNFLYMYKQHIPCILCTLCCGGPFYAAWFIQSIAYVLWAVFFGGWSLCSTCSFLSWWLAIVWPKGCWGSLFSLFSFASKMFAIFLWKSEKERFMHLRINFFLSNKIAFCDIRKVVSMIQRKKLQFDKVLSSGKVILKSSCTRSLPFRRYTTKKSKRFGLIPIVYSCLWKI